MDCFSTPNLLTVTQALQLLVDAMSPVKEIESISIADADKRIVAQDVVSPINVPQYDNSAMDGYALCDRGLSNCAQSQLLTQFKLVGESFAGRPFVGELAHGECIRIMTGAMIPVGTDAVIMQESTTVENQTVTIAKPVKLDANIRRAGEDIAQQQVVFTTGHRLNAIDIGLLASLGCSEVNVWRKLKIAILATGNELTYPGEPLAPGHIYETNSVVLQQLLMRFGAEVLSLGIIADDKAAIKEAFTQADAYADVVISSGGVSVGEADYTKTVLDEMGRTAFWKVAMKPGKPFAFGELPNSCFMGLPGNPVSASVTFHQLVLPALFRLAGATMPAPKTLTAITQTAIRKRPGRTDFQRGVWSVDASGQVIVTPLAAQGSGMLSSLSRANCFVVLAQDNNGHAAGDQVTISLFDDFLA
ncbi:MAG: molybdopterin molybdotransferase MoeA [Glaciecola sp.]|jgi:molybdopterin molybdotransferase|nr:molybdopterin molybdotransferase MoeA [Glaciecola sp.]MDG1814483.1 molybdopterin molybdotransferase MoeA [Glaciecola sp.]MDG2099585.1 molybdopterin molybdotransferase MoeA [Glaciecola sp.]